MKAKTKKNIKQGVQRMKRGFKVMKGYYAKAVASDFVQRIKAEQDEPVTMDSFSIDLSENNDDWYTPSFTSDAFDGIDGFDTVKKKSKK